MNMLLQSTSIGDAAGDQGGSGAGRAEGVGITPGPRPDFAIPRLCQLGDIDEDHRLTPGDALVVFQYALAYPDGDDGEPANPLTAKKYLMDVNLDGKVTPTDAKIIFEVALRGGLLCINLELPLSPPTPISAPPSIPQPLPSTAGKGTIGPTAGALAQ